MILHGIIAPMPVIICPRPGGLDQNVSVIFFLIVDSTDRLILIMVHYNKLLTYVVILI